MKIRRDLRLRINKHLGEFCKRWRTPNEFRALIEDLYDEFGMEFLITGYPDTSTPGTKAWRVNFTINGEDIENSFLIVNKYEGSITDEYNMYIS